MCNTTAKLEWIHAFICLCCCCFFFFHPNSMSFECYYRSRTQKGNSTWKLELLPFERAVDECVNSKWCSYSRLGAKSKSRLGLSEWQFKIINFNMVIYKIVCWNDVCRISILAKNQNENVYFGGNARTRPCEQAQLREHTEHEHKHKHIQTIHKTPTSVVTFFMFIAYKFLFVVCHLSVSHSVSVSV